jgi:hypothetical protein
MHLIHRTPPLSRPRKFLGLDDDDDVFVGMKGVVWLRGVCWRGLSRSARGRHRQSPAAEFLGIRGWLARLERDGEREKGEVYIASFGGASFLIAMDFFPGGNRASHRPR